MSAGGYGYEVGSYVWRGYGMWTQLWGMWLLPFALALTWRAIVRNRSLALAAVVAGATIACHLLTGYLVLVAIGVWVLVNPKPFRRRLWRAAAVTAGALATSAWLLVPALVDSRWTRMGLPPGTFWTDSYGAPKVVGWLVSGKVFDLGQLPVITILAGVGILVTLRRWRSDPVGRAVLAFFLASLVLYSGRPTFGLLIDRLPGQETLFLHRMIIGVHLGGIWLAGIGVAWLGQAAVETGRAWADAGRVPTHRHNDGPERSPGSAQRSSSLRWCRASVTSRTTSLPARAGPSSSGPPTGVRTPTTSPAWSPSPRVAATAASTRVCSRTGARRTTSATCPPSSSC